MPPSQLDTKTGSPPVDEPATAPGEEAVIEKVGGAIVQETVRRESSLNDPREAARRAAVEIASAMLEASSHETAAHSDDVDVITEGIARRLGISGQQLDDTLLAARLHDIGKLGVPLSIINKPGSLDRREWKLMHRHTIIGEQILLAVPELRGVAYLVRHSHERWDGRGYPDGLAGEEIPLGSRVVFCADAYHAIRSDRPYRKGRSAKESLAEIRDNAGSQFDPVVVAALEAVAEELRSRNGSRPRGARPRRLMALMLIVSVGATGSAFARSGVLPEADGPAQGAGSGSSASAGLVSGAPAAASPMQQLDALNAARVGATPGLIPAIDLMSALPPALEIPLEVGAPGLAETPGAETPGAETPGAGEDAESKSGAAAAKPGVRDHGQGVGSGKGQGKGRGAELGRGHQKSTGQKPKKAGAASGSGGRASANKSTSSASKGKAKSNSGGSSGSGQAAGTPKPAKPAKPATPAQPPAEPARPAQPTPPDAGSGNPGNPGGGNPGGGNPGGGNAGGANNTGAGGGPGNADPGAGNPGGGNGQGNGPG